MRVDQTQEFSPITITLETAEEAEALLRVTGLVSSNAIQEAVKYGLEKLTPTFLPRACSLDKRVTSLAEINSHLYAQLRGLT